MEIIYLVWDNLWRENYRNYSMRVDEIVVFTRIPIIFNQTVLNRNNLS